VPVSPCSGSKVQRGAPLIASNAAMRPVGEIDHRGTDHDDTVRRDRRRTRADLAEAVALVLDEFDLPVRAEALAALSGARVDRDEASVAGCGVEAVLAAAALVRRGHLGVGDTAATVRTAARARHPRVEAPALAARLRIECDDAIERRAVDQVLARGAGQQDRRGLRGDARRLPLPRRHVAIAMGPSRLETVNVRGRDVRRRAVVPAEGIASGVGGRSRADQTQQQHTTDGFQRNEPIAGARCSAAQLR